MRLVGTLMDGTLWYPDPNVRILKFNPYHGKGGLFATKDGGNTITASEGVDTDIAPVTVPHTRASLADHATGLANAAKARTEVLAAGLRFGTALDMPKEMLTQMQIKLSDTGAGATQYHVVQAQGVTAALKDLITSPRSNLRELHRGMLASVQVILAGSEPDGVVMTAITGGGTVQLVINTNHHAEDYVGQPSIAYAGLVGEQVIKAGGSKDQALAASARVAALHEFGHFFDRQMSNSGDASNSLLLELSEKLNDNGEDVPKVRAWLQTNISKYAGSTPADAFAEVFSMAVSGHPLPSELTDWWDAIQGPDA